MIFGLSCKNMKSCLSECAMMKHNIPHTPCPTATPGGMRFEEPSDIDGLVLAFHTRVPRNLGIHYLHNKWPYVRFDNFLNKENPEAFGWIPVDHQWNGAWRHARIRTTVVSTSASVAFRPLRGDGFPDLDDYDVTFRRTLGLRVGCSRSQGITEGNHHHPVSAGANERTHPARRGKEDGGTDDPALGPQRADPEAQSGGGHDREGIDARPGFQGKRSLVVALEHMSPAHP